MRKFIIFILVLSISIFSLIPSFATSGERVYAVDGGWICRSYDSSTGVWTEYGDLNANQPFLEVGQNYNFMFQNDSFLIPDGHSTVYGRYKSSAAPSWILINGLNASFQYLDGYTYFSVSGDIPQEYYGSYRGLVIHAGGVGAGYIQFDYCYFRTNSFLSISATANGDNISTLSGVEAVLSSGNDVEFSGNSLSGVISNSNVFYLDIDVPISSSQLILDSAFFQASLEISGGIAVDAHLFDDMGNIYPGSLYSSATFTDTVSNIHCDIFSYKLGEVSTYHGVSGVIRPDSYGDTFTVTSEVLTSDEFIGRYLKQYSYDTVVSVSPTSGALVTCDLSSYSSSASTLTLRVTILGDGGSYSPVVYLTRCGVFLNPADANLGDDAGVISSIKAFFENGISAIVSALTSGWNRLENAINGQDTSDADNFADSMETKAEELEDLADDLSAVTTPDVEQIDFDISDIVSAEDMSSGAAILTSSFDNSFVSSLLILVFTFALAGFVLYGKGA